MKVLSITKDGWGTRPILRIILNCRAILMTKNFMGSVETLAEMGRL